MDMTPTVLRTRVYVDGYNFYYGCLKRTPYKWLDLISLFKDSILPSVLYEKDGAASVLQLEPLALKFFTAPILKNFAKSQDSVSTQATYHRAIETHSAGRLQIIRGYYDAREARAHQVVAGKPAIECSKVDIWKLEEKQSDINLALHAYRDAVLREVDHVVFVTNDTDLAPAIDLIKHDTSAVVGLVVPTRDKVRPANSDLVRSADWVRAHITESELAASQLPRVVLDGGRKASHKPASWYPRPDLVEPAINEAMRVRGGRGAAMKWLGEPNPHFSGRVPLEMLNSDEGARELQEYMEAWASDHPAEKSSSS